MNCLELVAWKVTFCSHIQHRCSLVRENCAEIRTVSSSSGIRVDPTQWASHSFHIEFDRSVKILWSSPFHRNMLRKLNWKVENVSFGP